MRRLVCMLWLLSAIAPRADEPPKIEIAFHDGRVTIVATDASVAEILDEWSRVGGTRVVVDGLPAARRTISLLDVPENEAIRALLGNAPGVVLTERPDAPAGASHNAIIAVVRRTDAKRAVEAAHDAEPEKIFDYPALSPQSPHPDFAAGLRLLALDPSNPAVAPSPAGVNPEAVFEYALPSGMPAALVPPPFALSGEPGAVPPKRDSSMPIPELMYQYARPTPPLEDGSVALPDFVRSTAAKTEKPLVTQKKPGDKQ